jgi:hypothetical protein
MDNRFHKDMKAVNEILIEEDDDKKKLSDFVKFLQSVIENKSGIKTKMAIMTKSGNLFNPQIDIRPDGNDPIPDDFRSAVNKVLGIKSLGNNIRVSLSDWIKILKYFKIQIDPNKLPGEHQNSL